MVSSCWYHGDQSSLRATIQVIGGGEETPLNVVKLFKMGVSASGALDMSESSYLIIGYLLKGEQKELID